MVTWRISRTKICSYIISNYCVMDIKQKRPYTIEEEKILREGLSDIKVTYEDVAEIEIETPYVDSKIQDKFNEDKRDTENDPFKGTSIEGKD